MPLSHEVSKSDDRIYFFDPIGTDSVVASVSRNKRCWIYVEVGDDDTSAALTPVQAAALRDWLNVYLAAQ